MPSGNIRICFLKVSFKLFYQSQNCNLGFVTIPFHLSELLCQLQNTKTCLVFLKSSYLVGQKFNTKQQQTIQKNP